MKTVELSDDELSQISMSLAGRMEWLLTMKQRTGDAYYSAQYAKAATAHDKVSRALCK